MLEFNRLREESSGADAVFADLRGTVFRHAPQVVWTTVRGETVVFDVQRGKYESLNEVATSVWELLVDGSTFERIVDGMQEQYEVLPGDQVDQMRRDVAALLSKLKKARVIIAEPAA